MFRDIIFRRESCSMRVQIMLNAGIQFRMRILLNAIIDNGQMAIHCQSEGMAYRCGIVSR